MTPESEATLAPLDTTTEAPEHLTAADVPVLTAFDRCDAPDCSAQAYVRARFASGLVLDFCGHHGHALMPVLAGRGAVVRDDTGQLTGDRRL